MHFNNHTMIVVLYTAVSFIMMKIEITSIKLALQQSFSYNSN